MMNIIAGRPLPPPPGYMCVCTSAAYHDGAEPLARRRASGGRAAAGGAPPCLARAGVGLALTTGGGPVYIVRGSPCSTYTIIRGRRCSDRNANG
jgi:hypothetical protein